MADINQTCDCGSCREETGSHRHSKHHIHERREQELCARDHRHHLTGCSCDREPEPRGCGCGHDHGEGCGCGHEHPRRQREGLFLLAGGGLFALGLLLQALELRWVGLGLLGAAYLLLGLPVLTVAGKNILRGRVFDENFLMALATLGAFAIGEVPEAVGVMLFYRVGEYFEHRATERSRGSILAAVDLRPETVTLADGRVIPAGEARVGDVLLVRPGDRIPLDGQVLTGESRVDTSAITGESVPRAVKPGSGVLSGCLNTTGLLTLEVTEPLQTSMVSRILKSVEEAAARKPKMDRFLTRFSRVYTPLVVLAAVLTAVVPSLLTGRWSYWVYTALSFLVMSCPCALVVSVPLAFFSGIGLGGKLGILFKGGAALEALAGVKAAALDKTGTLTRGEFTVYETDGADVLRLCAAAEQGSNHPIAQSILEAWEGALPPCDALTQLPGLGVEARVEGKTLLCGSRTLLEGRDIPVPPLEGTAVYLAVDGAYRGYVRMGDRVKDETPAALAQLKKLEVAAAMVTGDQPSAAEAAAKSLGMETVYAGLLPQGKLEALSQLRRAHGPVLFVGDGINDAPVLAGADVGAAMGSGADAAIEAADVVFMTSRADAIPAAIRLARRTRAVAWQNVCLALGIKLLVMVLGLAGFANLWLAVLADTGVAMLCILNSIRLLYTKPAAV